MSSFPADDDRDWLDALAGRSAAPDAELATVKEGAVVRQAIETAQRAAPRFDVDAGARRLIARLRDERLFARNRFGWKAPAAAAAAALVIALGMSLRERPAPAPKVPEIPVMSGDPESAQTLAVQDPREIADEVRGMMTNAGLSPNISESGSVTRFEAAWPRTPSEAQLEFLRLYGLARPAGPRLKIEIRPRPQ